MPQITRESLMPLERYHKERPAFRARVIDHKKRRTLALGDHITLLFEDELTMRYQVQEMLRVERIFEEEGIDEELATYNPLIPDGRNFKATMLIEYPDILTRQAMLAQLKGIEDEVYLQVHGHGIVRALADEDIARENASKTSAVHFLRFELSQAMCTTLKAGGTLGAGVQHPAYRAVVDEVSETLRDALVLDLS